MSEPAIGEIGATCWHFTPEGKNCQRRASVEVYLVDDDFQTAVCEDCADDLVSHGNWIRK